MSSGSSSDYSEMVRRRINLKRIWRTIGTRLLLNGKTGVPPVSPAYRKPEIKPGVYDTLPRSTEVLLIHSASLVQAAGSWVGLTWQY